MGDHRHHHLDHNEVQGGLIGTRWAVTPGDLHPPYYQILWVNIPLPLDPPPFPQTALLFLSSLPFIDSSFGSSSISSLGLFSTSGMGWSTDPGITY